MTIYNVPLNTDAAVRDLQTVGDFVRYAVSQFNHAGVSYGHGTSNATDDAIFLVLEGLRLPIDAIEMFWATRLTADERTHVAGLISARVKKRTPASYLVNRAYIQGMPFFVDERVIVPRSFIGELLFSDQLTDLVPDPATVESVLDLCTGSGCLAILAAHVFPNATIDAVELSPDARDVARRNIVEYGLEDRINLHHGDLFAPVSGKKYDLILTNPPYVDADAMADLPDEYRAEPEMALVGGDDDGMAIVRRILADAAAHLNDHGGIMCELGQGQLAIEESYPDLPFQWLDTENSAGEVFWLTSDQIRGDEPAA